MISVVLTIAFGYLLFVCLLLIGWNRVKKPLEKTAEKEVSVSVVIAVRNEEKTIAKLLDDLSVQKYPAHLLEVLVVDDFSTDQTRELILAKAKEAIISIQLVEKPSSFKDHPSPKKTSLAIGIEQAKGEYILVTDGDCSVSEGWVASHVNCYLTRQAGFVTGPVAFSFSSSLWAKVQKVEFASLVGSGAATLGFGIPTMANAANMSFPKEVFKAVNGFEGLHDTPSGDDELLMHKIKKEKYSVQFLKEEGAIVETKHQTTGKSFLNQRKRWASKWKYYQSPAIKWLAAITFLFHVNWLVFYIFSTSFSWSIFGMLVGGKLLLEYLFLSQVMRSLKQRVSFRAFVILQFVHSLYIVYTGFSSKLTSFTWKERKYT
ncbi:MAG: glycosyltransferase [Cyclobacteriaceae bacterium]